MCHLCDKMEKDNFSDVSFDEERLAELERLANGLANGNGANGTKLRSN